MKILKLLSITTILLGHPLHAESPLQLDIFEFDDIFTMGVMIQDDATGGCWTNAGEAKSYAEDQLRLVGVNVAVDDELISTGMNILVSAQRLQNGQCIGHIELRLDTPVEIGEKTILATVYRMTGHFLNVQNGNIVTLDFIKSFLSAGPFVSG